MLPPDAFDPARCPLCGAPNRCAMELARASGEPQPDCWCTQVRIAPEVLARVPAQAVDRACLCPACATALPPA